jgi:hypothetical protein
MPDAADEHPAARAPKHRSVAPAAESLRLMMNPEPVLVLQVDHVAVGGEVFFGGG